MDEIDRIAFEKGGSVLSFSISNFSKRGGDDEKEDSIITSVYRSPD